MDQHHSGPFFHNNPIEGINAMSNSLRGGNSKNEDPAGAIDKLKDFMKSLSTSLWEIQNSYKNGDTDESGKTLKELIGDSDVNSVVSTFKGDHPHETFDADTLTPNDKIISLNDIPTSTIGEHIRPQMFDSLASLSNDISDALEDIDLSLFEKSPPMREKNLHSKSRSSSRHTKKTRPKKEPQPQFASGNDFPFFLPDSAFGNFIKNPTARMHSIHKQLKMHQKGISLPKISTIVSVRDYETVMSKHQLREEAMGICRPKCSVADDECNCKRLFNCVTKLDEYDMAV